MRTLSRHLPAIARILMGLTFFVCGLNGFLDFLPHPTEPMSQGAMSFAGGLMSASYFFPLLKGIETLVGVLLLTNRFVPLALALVAPIVVNIFAFHAFLQPSGLRLAMVLLVLEIYLAWSYRRAFRPMLALRVAP